MFLFLTHSVLGLQSAGAMAVGTWHEETGVDRPCTSYMVDDRRAPGGSRPIPQDGANELFEKERR